jgi:DNA primase
VAVAPDGMDPCDLRLKSGDGALRDLVARRTPLFEFAIRSALAEMDLDSAEGRVAALRRCVPMVSQIKDPTLRDEYARQLAGWVGWDDVAQVIDRVRSHAKSSNTQARGGSAPKASRRAAEPAPAAAQAAAASRPDPRDPTLWPQREALKAALQYPAFAGPVFDTLTVESFTHPGYAAIRAAIETAGGTSSGVTGAQWIEAVRDQASSPLTAGLASELGVEAIQVDEEKLPRYIGGVLARLQEVWMGRQIAEVKSKLQRMSPIEQGDEYHALFGDLVAMESYRRSLLEQASGDD